MNPRLKLLALSDQALCALIALLLLGATLGFGGAVWWFRSFLAIVALAIVMLKLAQYPLMGRMCFLKSPLTLLGLMTLGLAALQLAPLPGSLASRISPLAREVYARGVLPNLVHNDDPETKLPDAPVIRSPATLDRAATVRWIVAASACLGIFWAVSHFTTSLGRLYLIWGLIVGGFLLNTALAVVQITHRSEGLYGMYLPGRGPWWSPSMNDLLESPTATTLTNLEDQAANKTGAGVTASAATAGAVLAPNPPFLFGTLMGGPGAFLAMGAMAMPLALAIVLHLIAPRGSRESLGDRLGQSSQISLVVLMVLLMLLGATVTGLAAGPWFSLPVAIGLAVVGFPAVARPSSRWVALSLTGLLLAGLGLGVAMQGWWPLVLGGQSPVQPPDSGQVKALWKGGLEVARHFPFIGSGFGSFATIHPYFKEGGESSTTAMSTLIQWAAESGLVGLGILGLAALWCLIRLPSGVKRIGLNDRSLAHGLIGAVLSFSLLAVVHWTVELSAVAISASALGGTWNRWLAGGTDLFVERG